MALTINGVQQLKTYFEGVMNRADHHADNVNEIVLALIGGVIWKSGDDVQVKQYNDAPANILWMYCNNQRYCFTFNHETGDIEIKAGSMKGEIIQTFNNQSAITDIKSFFNSL